MEQVETPHPPNTFCRATLLLLVAFLCLFPIVPLTLSVILGGLLAWAEVASFHDGFLYVSSNLLNMATPLTEINPINAIGVTIDVYISVVALLCFGIIINIVNIFQVPAIINQTIESTGIKGQVMVNFTACAIVIPALFVCVASFFGSILALVEGWWIADGILYVLGNILRLSTPLTDVLPNTTSGEVLDVIISSNALGCVAVCVDYVTGLNPARYLRRLMVEFLERRGLLVINDSGFAGRHPLDYGQLADDISLASFRTLGSRSTNLEVSQNNEEPVISSIRFLSVELGDK
eukprot:CAMPEP_0198145796 /NCGR_PEP_ID=MMETSP1443-20131203/25427_1 /TAXON_ID=186043 /ORGANISM="Entomoneis sp., Strain CCMP2396" /LENGTH=291 /DNA_ID=CAMNT_0043809523 /DNA_START=159 /DNA_END=1034 /DNA_ORIENTATION=+